MKFNGLCAHGFLACVFLLSGSAAGAQSAGDVINLFGGVLQGAIVQANRTEWSKISQPELECVDRSLRENGISLSIAIQRGIGPADPRLASVRAECWREATAISAPDTAIYYVANTRPPDAFLSLRTNPSSTTGRRITTMPNDTALRVLRKQSDGWWLVQIVATGQQGWAYRGTGGNSFIECCMSPAGAQPAAPQVIETNTDTSPSFDCRRATHPDERVICTVPELALLDRTVVAGFNYVRQKQGDNFARSLNTPFYLARRSCGSDAVCIKERQLAAIARYQFAGAPIALPMSGTENTLLWNLNGSTLQLVASGRSRKFFYKQPRAAIRDLGVREGFLLFEGEANGDQYDGTAFFSNKCGRSAVHVSGPILDSYRRVELRGEAPVYDDGCRVSGYADSKLSLQLIEPPPVAANGAAPALLASTPPLPTPSQQEKDIENFKSIKEKALAGDANAQIGLADLYATGKGTQKDAAEGINWLRKAADQGNIKAQAKLAEAYMFGIGIREDNKEAATWYAKAADQGDANSQYRLGLMYDKGTGVEQSGSKAIELIRKAADQGHAGAKKHLAQAATTLARVQSARDRIAAEADKVANAGLRQSLKDISNRLGNVSDIMTTEELKVTQDEVETATRLFQESDTFNSTSRAAAKRLNNLDEAMSKIYFDAPLIKEIKATMAAARASIAEANLKSLTEQMAKLDEIYDPKRIALLREATLHGFDTIEAYDQYLTERAKLGRSGIILKQ